MDLELAGVRNESGGLLHDLDKFKEMKVNETITNRIIGIINNDSQGKQIQNAEILKAVLSDHNESHEAQESLVSQYETDQDKVYTEMQSRKTKAEIAEIRLKKIVIVLGEEGYSQKQINQILNYHLSSDNDLSNDLVKKYDETHKSDPDISYMR
jgi:uncharacterized protein (UPF0297 family)